MKMITYVDGGNVYRIEACSCGSKRIRSYYLEEKQQMLLSDGVKAHNGFTYSVLDRSNYQFECDNCETTLNAEIIKEEFGKDCECEGCPPWPAKEDFEPVPDKLVDDLKKLGKPHFNLKNRLEGM